MSQDSVFSSVHFTHPNQALFMEKWREYAIPYDDIDTSRLFEATASIFPQFLLEDEEDGAIPLHSSVFGAKVSKNKNSLKDDIWNDLSTEVLRSNAMLKKTPDNTILRPLHYTEDTDAAVSINDFLANGYNREVLSSNADTLTGSVSHEDIWLNLTSEYPMNHTFSMKMRSNSYTGQQPVQTPRVGRTRQHSQDKFQTPITRIMR